MLPELHDTVRFLVNNFKRYFDNETSFRTLSPELGTAIVTMHKRAKEPEVRAAFLAAISWFGKLCEGLGEEDFPESIRIRQSALISELFWL